MTDDVALRLEVITVAEAASTLRVHPTQVRTLIRRGDLAGERIGSQWVISRAALDRYGHRSHRAGRPFSQRIAWALLAKLEGVDSPWPLAREERARIARYAARPLGDLAQRLAGRAETRRLSVGPTGLARLDPTTRWRCGDTSTTARSSVIYVPISELDTVFEASNAVDDAEQPNLIVRMVDDAWWPFGELGGGAAVWSVVQAIDRYDANEQNATTGGGATLLSR